MPLMPGKSKKAFGHNIGAELAAGKPRKQAIAIAYSEKERHMAEGGEMEDMPEQDDKDQMLDDVASELCDGIERRDHKMVRDAIKALVLHIQDEDQEQDDKDME